jgi:GNAT superfamily N-acetyltransferase
MDVDLTRRDSRKSDHKTMHIRKATRNDSQVIGSFQIAMARETENICLDTKTVTEGIKAVFEDPSRGIYFVAEKQGEVVGSLMVTFEWSDWRNSYFWWIQSVYVKPEIRRKGVFKQMYLYLHERVKKESSLCGLRLYAEKTNRIAQHTYKSLGMNADHYVMFEWMKP